VSVIASVLSLGYNDGSDLVALWLWNSVPWALMLFSIGSWVSSSEDAGSGSAACSLVSFWDSGLVGAP
jgi:hypothetical protein